MSGPPTDDEIRATWSDPDSPASYAGRKYVIGVLREKYPDIKYGELSSRVARVLSEEPGYTIHFPRRRRFLTGFYNIASYYRLLEVDLADVQGLAEHNNGIKYLLVGVEAASRAIFVEPLRDKTARVVVQGMSRLLERMPHKVSVIRSDRGSEFKSKAYMKLLHDYGARVQYASNESKAA